MNRLTREESYTDSVKSSSLTHLVLGIVDSFMCIFDFKIMYLIVFSPALLMERKKNNFCVLFPRVEVWRSMYFSFSPPFRN